MKKINFKRLEIFTDLQKKTCSVVDAREQLSNLVYGNSCGFVGHVLAHKIYESDTEVELTDAEARELGRLVVSVCYPPIIDAILGGLGLTLGEVMPSEAKN